jgi:hypothetical protein
MRQLLGVFGLGRTGRTLEFVAIVQRTNHCFADRRPVWKVFCASH